jgi:enoyl-[acyl-carrier-protein] reductase (NADH)
VQDRNLDFETPTRSGRGSSSVCATGDDCSKIVLDVNAIPLGLINNGGGVAAILADETISAAMRGRIPLSFVGEPDDIAWGAVYLASDQARYVTGVLLPIDGGASGTTVSEETGGTGWAEPQS